MVQFKFMTRKIMVPSKFNLDVEFNSYNFLVLNLHAHNLSPILADNMHAPNCLFAMFSVVLLFVHQV